MSRNNNSPVYNNHDRLKNLSPLQRQFIISNIKAQLNTSFLDAPEPRPKELLTDENGEYFINGNNASVYLQWEKPNDEF